MKKENLLVIVLICIAVASVFVYKKSISPKKADLLLEKGDNNESGASAIDWQAYTVGMALAKKSNKHIFLYFHADWCTYCQKLKKTTFKDKEILAYLRDNFVSIAVDTDHNRELSTQWKVTGLPTLWFLKPDNSKISNIPGYVDKKQLLNVLKYIHTQSYDKLSFHEFVKTI